MISIITVNYNNARLTADCVSRTIKILTDISIKYEILIVDNCSTDSSYSTLLEIFTENPNIIILLSDKNGGFGYGNNFAISHCRYDILWFINSDAWCTEIRNWEELISCIQMPDTGLVTNIMVDTQNNPFPLGGFKVDVWHFLAQDMRLGTLYRNNIIIKAILNIFFKKSTYIEGFNHIKLREPKLTSFVCGASFFIEKSKYNILKGFDEAFFLYYEDLDITYVAEKKGFKNYISPEVVVATVSHSTTGKLNSTYLQKIKYNSRTYFIKKHFRGVKKNILLFSSKLFWRLH